MTDEFYIVAITALLPLMAILLVVQTNPYSALVIRGILGAIAALVYAMFGAADVALTEALVGTMLSITLYAIAVRSSMTLRLGIIQQTDQPLLPPPQLMSAITSAFTQHNVRVELLPHPDQESLIHALNQKELHAIYEASGSLRLRTQSLYNILHSKVPTDTALVLSDTQSIHPEKSS